MSEETTEAAAPLGITVSGGNPTDEELGAVLAVLSAAVQPAAAASTREDRPRAGGWGSHTRGLRRNLVHGRDAWRFSGIPGAM